MIKADHFLNSIVSKRRWLAFLAYKCATPIDFKTPYFTLAIRTGFLCKNIEILAIFAFGSILASLR